MRTLALLALLVGCEYSFPEGWCNNNFADEDTATRYYYKTRSICQQTPAHFSECMRAHNFKPCK